MLRARETPHRTPMLAARKLRDRAWEIHQAAAGTRKIVLEGDANPEKYWRPANQREPSTPSFSFRIWKTPLQLKRYHAARSNRCGRTKDCNEPLCCRRC